MLLWRKLVRLVFQLLYNQLAWSYDWVSRVVSKGEWQRWQQAVIPRLHGHRALDLGCGTGALLLNLVAHGYHPWGIDVSARMLAVAVKKARDCPIQLSQAQSQALPLASESFDSVTVTFPSDFIDDSTTLSELWRVIAPGGRLIIVDSGRLLSEDLPTRMLNWLFRITSRPAIGPDAGDVLTEVGFDVTRKVTHFPTSVVSLLIAEKGPR